MPCLLADRVPRRCPFALLLFLALSAKFSENNREGSYLIGRVLNSVEWQILVESFAIAIRLEQGVVGGIVSVFGFVLADGGIGA